MIVGLVSCYREGRLAADAARSLLACCETVLVFDSPIGEPPAEAGIETDWTLLKRESRVVVRRSGRWESDAIKRTAMLDATRRFPAPTWGVIVDGDELLMYGEQLPALIEHHEQEAAAQGRESFGATLRLVESDGGLGFIGARVLRLDLIERWLVSSYHLLLKVGVEVAKPNAYVLAAGEPDSAEVEPTTGMQIRRPLQGEPHILHRSLLRPPQREPVERQSAAEGSQFERLLQETGLAGIRGDEAADDRPGIWLPR